MCKFTDFNFMESRRDSGPKPRVAPQALPWDTREKRIQPQRGCGAPIPFDDTTLSRLLKYRDPLPRVARSSQPWAE
jgi:hypothetical protein